MPQSRSIASLMRRQAQVSDALQQLAGAQDSLNKAALKTISELESATQQLAYRGLNFASLLDALCPPADLSTQVWLPRTIGTIGSGPWHSEDFDQFLRDRQIHPVEVPHADIDGLVVGVEGWSVEDLEAQIYGRTPDDLRVYTQELLVIGLVLDADPYDVLEQAPIDDVGNNHPAIQHILNRDFRWPWPTQTSTKAREDFDDDFFNWQEESVLKRLGYTARADGPGPLGRQQLLAKAFELRTLPGVQTPDHQLRWGPPMSAQRLKALSGFLAWLIAFQGRDKLDARAKWIEDLEWLKLAYYRDTMAFSWPSPDERLGDSARRTPNAAFMKPLIPSPQLAAIIGPWPVPRTEAVSKLWGYIKKNNLQDPKNKRLVNADDKLFEVFGQQAVSMFAMAERLGRHLKGS